MDNCAHGACKLRARRGYSGDPSSPHLGRQGTKHGGARIRFLGGRDMNTAERSRGTSKYINGRFVEGRVLTKAVGFLGAGGHSVRGCSLLSSDVGVLGSASSSSSSATAVGFLDSATTSSFAAATVAAARRCSASGGVESKAEDAKSGAVAGSATAALVLIGVSAGRRTSPASGDLIWRGELWVLRVGIEAVGWVQERRRGRRVET